MALHTDTEQERAAFEDCFKSLGVGPYQPHNNMYVADEIQARWEAWQARAALQSQGREDAERLDWIEANHGCDITEFADGTWEVDVPDGPYGVGKGMREAIDHARLAEGDGE